MIQADGADFWADRSSVPRTFGLACVPPELFSSPRFSVEWCQRWRAGLSLAVSGGAPDNSLSCRQYAILDKGVGSVPDFADSVPDFAELQLACA